VQPRIRPPHRDLRCKVLQLISGETKLWKDDEISARSTGLSKLMTVNVKIAAKVP
jgi:hypothetical protein